MALQLVLDNWRQRLDAIQNPSLEALNQALEETVEQLAQAVGIDVENLKTLIYFLDEIQLRELHQRAVEIRVEDGANENVAQVEAARGMRDEISEFLGGIQIMNVNQDNMQQDGGRRRRRRRTTRRR